jgi:uncharacterized protein YdeI (BOF family)
MKRMLSVLATMLLTTALLPLALGQSQSQQPHPVDPTAQSPATPPQGSTPPTFPSDQSADDKSASSNSSESAKTFMGNIVQRNGDYVLRSGYKEYKLDDQSKANEYVGKDVKILGTLDRQSNEIKVQSIDISPAI